MTFDVPRTMSRRVPAAAVICLATLYAFMPQAPEWQGFTGLADHQLLQRSGDAAIVSLHGTAPAAWNGSVLVTAPPLLDRDICGRAGEGAWQCSFRLPTNGPYDVRLTMLNAWGRRWWRRPDAAGSRFC